jgi:hypothetical protein
MRTTTVRRRRRAPDEQRDTDTSTERIDTTSLHPPVHCNGYPTRAKIEALHHRWFDTGITLVVELQR